jgi:1-acyl-sn-glycerol-3-phosphate acyltransferase
MEEKKYPEILAQKDDYFTPDISKKKFVINPTLGLYSLLVRVILYSNRQVKKGIYDSVNWVKSSLDIFHSIEKIGGKFEITGMKNISSFEGPAVFISNHMSTLETLILPSIIQPIKPVVYVIKNELLKFPFFGSIANARYPIVVGRQNPREDLKIVLEEGTSRLKEGRSIIIFPQKTRDQYFRPKSFNTLGVKLAKRNNVPVVPVALATDAYSNGKIIKEMGKFYPSNKIHFAFDKPLQIKSNGAEEHQQILDFITKKFKEWGKEELIKE